MSAAELIIVGAGNLGRELLCWARDIPEDRREWADIKGYLDDNLNALDGYHTGKPILSTISDYVPQPNDRFVCAIADPKIRLKVCRELEAKGAQFVNLIHPTCVMGAGNRIGKGLVMCPFSLVSTNVTIGDFVIINVYSAVCHDAVVEDGVTLSNHCDVTGFVHLERGVFVGSGARLLPKARVGQFAVIGAGCVVLDKVEPRRTVAGVPARYID